MPGELIAQVEAWATANETTRSDAIRRLVELGLTVKPSAKSTNKAERTSRARDLASTAVDKLSDPDANPEVRNERRKMLIKGPSEFREARVDLPKAKK
jgi:hypothetical protein